MNRHFTLSKALTAILLFIGIALRQSAFAQTTWSLQPTSSGNTITYKVKRSGDISQAVTVRYRTVGLSSYEGENFTAANGTLTFPAGINEKTVTVTAQTPSTEAYKYYQSGATRKYLFEVTDMGGFSLVSKEDNAGAGTVFNTSYLNQSVTDLVYFTYNGAIQSGDGNKYVDASHSGSSDWVQVTESGYSQAVHTISTNNLYSNNSSDASFRSYLNAIGYNMYATVYFTQKEEQDGYQYIQILADNSTSYDGDDPDGKVNAPSTSLYKACFILSYDPSGSVMSDAHYQFFPHRYDYVDMAAEQTAGISHYEFDYDNSHLYQQKFRTTSYQASTSGSLVLAPTVNNLNVRFDAAGSGGDTWDFKNLKVRLALVDATKPTIRNNNDIRVADGAYGYGNTVYITIPFTEIVTVTGSPTLSTTWGTLNYVAGSGTNVLTFSGHIEADLGTVLTVNSIGGTSFTIKDLMGNTYNSTSINKTYSGLQVTNPWTGSGTANDPYIIMDRYQLDLLSKLVWAGNYYENKYFKLGANITYSSSTSWSNTSSFTSNFTSIGGWGHSFRGVFDGDGHSISGIRIYKNGTANVDECQGIFGLTYSGSMVKNLVLYDINIVGKNQVGVLVGSAGGTIQDCYIYNARAQAANGSSCGIINGSGTSTIARAYYKDCMIGSNTGQHNIGKLTLNDGATVTRTPVTTLNTTVTTYNDGVNVSNEEFYTPNIDITLGYSGSVPQGSFVKYTASTSSGDITYTNIDGNVLTMPDADVTVSATILPVVTYLDADGNAQQCSDYTLITSSNSNVSYGASGKTHWYVVSSDATINAKLVFNDATDNIILCNGATLNVNRTDSGTAVVAQGLNIFGQTNGTGTLNVTASNGSCLSPNALGIYGGIVSASGGDHGINAGSNSITLGYTAATNRITASSYNCSSLTVKAGQTLTDGEGHLYSGTYSGDGLDATLAALAGKTLQPAYSLTLPDHFTVTGTTAPQGFAPAGETVTLHTDEGYTITAASYTPAGGSATTITPVEGVWSFTMPTANTTVSATRVVHTYTVHFDANATNGINATGTMEDMNFTYNQAQNLTTNDFERTGYTFDGWNTAADGSGDAYTDGQNVNNLTNVLNGLVTLYAQWSVISWEGNGTSENDPYLIIYASQLVKLSEDVNGGKSYPNKFFKLGNDIDMNGVAFDGIGYSNFRSFIGTFDGDGKTVSNVIVNKSEQDYVGFFGNVRSGGTVKNLILDGVSIAGDTRVGALVGSGYNCSIENCLVMNSSVTCANLTFTGIICGNPDGATLTDNHYRNCTLTKGNNTSTINIGIGSFSYGSSDVDGARSIHTLDVPEHVTATSTDMLTYDNVTYYASNVEVTLTPAQGITLADVTVNGVAATHQQDETWTFTMPATDATVTCTSSVPYIDADGNQQTCTDFTIIESSESSVDLNHGGPDEWYVVSGNVNINGQLFLRGGNCHLILCDGATLNINPTNNADGLYCNNLIIYGQSVGNGTLTASAPWSGIHTNNSLTINGGIISVTSTTSTGLFAGLGNLTINRGNVTAHGHYDGMEGQNIIINGGIVNATNGEGSNSYGIIANLDITLGYTELTDRITASSYKSDDGTISVKAGQALYDGTAAAYSGTLNSTQIDAIAGKTLEPCFILTLPELVNATGVISQEDTTAYALAGAEITLAAAEGYEITGGTTSFTMPAQDIVSDVTVQVITYNISYDLAGGSVTTANPVTYTVETPTFTLNNPTREHFTFAGWIGTGFSDPTTTVTIEQGSTGDREYYANWTPNLSEFWGNGDGSQEYPYIITDTIGLNMLATLVNEGYDLGDNKTYFELGANIQYDNTVDNNFKPIGHGEGGDHSFSEVFDGKGYTISGIRVSSSIALQGVFGWSWGGTVRNVILTDAIFSGGEYYAGGIVGNNKGTVENCLVIDVTVSGNEYQGAVVGFNDQGTVTNSYYHNCTVGSESNLSNAYIVTAGDYVTASIEYYSAGIEYDGTLYAPVDATVSLDLAYSGTIPEGYRLAYYTVNNEPIDGDTFEMPAADVVIEAVLLEHYYTYNSTTGELALIYGEFNKDNKWGNDVTPSAVTSVTATNEVSFTGDCTNLFFGFTNCTSMDLNNVNTEGVTNMACMFEDCSSLNTLDLSYWNTGAVTRMDNLFFGCTKLKTLNLTGWDVSHVISMPVVFYDCQSLTTIEGITQWNPSRVTGMHSMFEYCKSLKSLDLSGWNTESLTDMDVMFMGCDSIQTLNLSGWDVSNVTDMNSLFWGCKSLETLDVSGWNTSSVTNMGQMFYDCSSLTTLHRSEWNTEKVNNMGGMFYRCSSLTTLDLSDWNTESVTDMWSMFTYCSNLATIYAGEGWSVESAASAGGGMFYDCTSLVGGMGTTYNIQHTNGDYAHIDGGPDNPGYLSRVPYTYDSESGTLALLYGLFNKDNKWGNDVPIAEVTSVTATDEVSFTGDCSSLFRDFTNCTSMDLSQVNTGNVTNMNNMFLGCTALESLDLSNWNTGSVTNMGGMFTACSNLESLDLSNWNTGSVTNMGSMFTNCGSLTTLDIANWNTAAVTNMNNMFIYCSSLESLDLSGWNTSNVTNISAMFNGCSNLTTIYVGEGWNAENVTGSGGMFGNCTSLVGGMGTEYDPEHVNGDYAHIDGGPSNPGYLSAIPLDPVEYIDADGNTQTCTNYTLLKGSNYYSSCGDNDVEAWYVVDHDVTYSDGLQFNGSANLILVDGATLTINDDTEGDGGYMSSSDRLTIYVQSNGTGAITAVNSSISASGDLIIHGGHITLSSDNSQAVLWSWGDLTINGGEISIENSDYYCIYVSGQLTINDGTLNAVVTEEDNAYDVIYSDEDVVINGGIITLTNQGYGRGIVGDNVTINGGSVKVYIAHEDDYSGIATDGWGGITLGWTDASDLIMSQGGYNADQLSIATGLAFTDGEGNYYFGTYYLYEMPDLAGKTLVPFTNLSETFNITYVTDGGTLPEGYPTTYTFGETVVLPIPTKEDNAFAGWFDNAEFEGYFITEIEAGTTLGNKTFYALWKPEYTDVTYLDADGQTQTAHAKVLYGIETELLGGVYTIVEDEVYFDKLSFTGNTTIILPDNKYLYVKAWGKGTNDDEYGLFVNGDLTIYGQEHGDGLFNSYNVQVSGDVAIYGGYHDIGYLSANNGSGTITLSWTGWNSSIRVGVYLGKVVFAKAFIDDDDNIHEAGTVADVTTINGQWLYPFITETEVSYLDENGVLQTVTATVLYGGEEAEYPGGVYTVLDMVIRGQAYYDRLHFTGDATIIIPDWCSLGVAATKEDNEYWMHVDGNLTIYGQEYGNGECLFSNVTVNGHVNVYGGWVVLYNISANEINLSWTSIQNEFMVNPTQGTTVNLLKDFMYYDDDHNRHVINAQQGVDIATIATYYLKPYAETMTVSYLDENGDTHTVNATVLFGDETNLDGGIYTIMGGISFHQAVSFSGDTKLIIPDGTYFYGYTQDNSFFEGEVINVNVSGDLAIYGQENRSGTVLYINASVSDAVTVSNVRVINSFINSESDILIAGGEHEYGQLSANGTITLGYLTFNDQIYCEDYEGTVAIRAGQKFAHQNGPFGDVILTGTLTDEEVAAIAGTRIYPYIEPTVTQTIALTAGWNWVSINVEVTLNELKAALVAAEPGASPTIKSKGKGQTAYNGTIWTGALKSIDLSQMYEIKVANNCEVMLEGVPVNPADHPVTIKSGANWIAYPLSTDMSVANAFADFGVKGDYVKSKTGGQAAWNGMIWTGALKRLVPGQGYIYNSTVSGDRTFTFPSEDQ